MTDTTIGIRQTLLNAADRLDDLYNAAYHVPAPLTTHAGDMRGLLTSSEGEPVAQAYFGGLAEVIQTLDVGMLPVLAVWLRTQAKPVQDDAHDTCTTRNCTVLAAQDVAVRILSVKESQS